jgi:WD40 repeat protein
MRYFALAISIVIASMGCDGSASSTKHQVCLRTFSGHTNYVCDVAFSPSGKQIVSGGADGKIKFWDVESGQCQRTLDGHEEWVHSVVISPDGRFLASGGRDNSVKWWDVESGKLLKTFVGHSELVKSVAYSPDGRFLVSCAQEKAIRIWDVESGKFLKPLGNDDFFSSSTILFTLDGKQVLYGGLSLTLWDIDTGECLRTFIGHSDSLRAAAISRKNQWIASAGAYTDRSLRLWDAKSGNCLWKKDFTEQEGGVWSLVFASEDRVLVSGNGDGTIRYWDVKSGKCLRSVKAHSDLVSCLSIDITGQYLASGGWDNCIKLWKIPPNEPADQ